MIEVQGESQIVDSNTGKMLVSQSDQMAIYGKASSSEEIFERMQIEQKVWKSIEKGINCKNYCRKIL